MGNNKNGKSFIPDTRIYLLIMTLFVIIITMYNYIIGSIGIVLLAYFVYQTFKVQRNRKEMWTKYIENLSSDMNSVTRQVVLNLPIPLVVVEFDGNICWHNSKFSDMLEVKALLEQNIEETITGFKLHKVLEKEEIEVDIKGKTYNILYDIVKIENEEDSRYVIMLYFIEITDFKELKIKYDEEKLAVLLIEVDNYDDVLRDTKEEKRPFIMAEIDQRIKVWAARMDASIKKYQKNKYIIFLKNTHLDKLEAKKFTILDEIREIEVDTDMPITLSIGVGIDGKNPAQLESYAGAAMDLALGRGGDQAVVKKDNEFNFYGGKTKAVEKRNKVKARVVAHALRQLIDQSKNVIIMGHKNPDMDCLGAALGVYRAAKNRGKDACIVLNDVSEAIRNLFDKVKTNEEYVFDISEDVLNRVNKDTLVVVVDTHRPSITECPEILEVVDKIVLIDHHRRGVEFIDHSVLTYLEPYASSACELVAEILQYMEDKINIEKIEAEALLAGITVDTKNFSFKTGVRTFEAAAWLRRVGADTTNVRQLFQDDIETLVAIIDVVKNAKEIRENIVISVCRKDVKNISLIVAQGADELLNIRGIGASFVLGIRNSDEVIISARSLGNINVQVILEKLGGGGHLTVAGAQIRERTVEEVIKMIEKVIDEYFEEGGEQ